MTKFQKLMWPGVFLAVVVATGCASSVEIPDQDFQAVRTSIDEAMEVEGNRYAGEDMLAAQRKLTQAENAAQNGEEENAVRLLQEAKLHAEFAEIAALDEQARESLSEINTTLNALQRELER